MTFVAFFFVRTCSCSWWCVFFRVLSSLKNWVCGRLSRIILPSQFCARLPPSSCVFCFTVCTRIFCGVLWTFALRSCRALRGGRVKGTDQSDCSQRHTRSSVHVQSLDLVCCWNHFHWSVLLTRPPLNALHDRNEKVHKNIREFAS